MDEESAFRDGSCCPPEFRCICDPDDLFEPPDPTPRAVEGCPAHRARRAYQKWAEQRRAGSENTDG
jgi:hypothetical protein